jgi:hypothetical protein
VLDLVDVVVAVAAVVVVVAVVVAAVVGVVVVVARGRGCLAAGPGRRGLGEAADRIGTAVAAAQNHSQEAAMETRAGVGGLVAGAPHPANESRLQLNFDSHPKRKCATKIGDKTGGKDRN